MSALGFYGLGLWEAVILIFAGGGLGVPVGLPPREVDPLLVKIAPEECLYYFYSAGMAEPDGESENLTEQFLADPEVKQFAEQVEQRLKEALAAAPVPPETGELIKAAVPPVVKSLLTQPLVLYVSRLEIKDKSEPPAVQGCLVVNAGDRLDELQRVLARLETTLLREEGLEIETVEIESIAFKRFRPPAPGAPSVTWGARGRYLVIGVGDESVENLFAQAKTEPPAWIMDAARRVNVPRRATFSYANIQAMLKIGAKLAEKPEIDRVLQKLGVANVSTFAASTGLDEEGFVSRTWLGLEGEPKGIFSVCGDKPLTAEDLAPIPGDATMAMAARADGTKVYDLFLDVVGEVAPRGRDEVAAELAGMEDALGFRLRDDLLAGLGEVWTLYADSAEGSLLTGWTLVVDIRDRDRLAAANDKLRMFFSRLSESERDAPAVKQFEFAGRTINMLQIRESFFPFAVSWCMTDKHFVMGLYPQTVKAFLGRGGEGEPLAARADVAAVLKGGGDTVFLSYVDARQIFPLVYSAAAFAAQQFVAEVRRAGVEIDIAPLPSAPAIGDYLRPSVMRLARTDGGLEVVQRQSLPGGNLAMMAPVAVASVVPAVLAAKGAADRAKSQNNLRQIVLAMHNYHDVLGGFPAAFNADEEGKPLLSWRVHILPFIEQDALYRRFHLDEPWDSEHNKTLIPLMPDVYLAPGSEAGEAKTNYVTIRSESSAIVVPPEEKYGVKMPTGISISSITDGTSNTILAVEATDKKAVMWTKPDDYQPDRMSPMRDLVGLRADGFLAAMCDGSVRMISSAVETEMIKRLFTRNDGEVVDIDR